MTAPTINRPYFAGEERVRHAGQVDVVMQCVRPDAAYRVSVRYHSTNAEVGDLSKSHLTEDAAREHANTARVLFLGGVTVTEALDMQEARA